jgi:hypothetical protein
MGDRNRVGIGFRSLESILGLLESLKIRAQFLPIQHIEQSKCIKLTFDTNIHYTIEAVQNFTFLRRTIEKL